MLEQLVQVLLMLLVPHFWTRYREVWMMGQDVRSAIFIMYETLVGHPIEALRYASGGAVRVLPYPVVMQILGLQRPKTAAFRWAVSWAALFWFSLYLARSDGGGIEGMLFRARVEKGWWLVGMGAGVLRFSWCWGYCLPG
jgi:hypothetical protein